MAPTNPPMLGAIRRLLCQLDAVVARAAAARDGQGNARAAAELGDIVVAADLCALMVQGVAVQRERLQLAQGCEAHGPLKLIATVSLGSARTFELRPRAQAHEQEQEQEQERIAVGAGGGGVEHVLAPALGEQGSSMSPIASVRLKAGSMVVMAGETQAHWLHQLPLPVPRDEANHRISLTFRSIVPGFEDSLEPATARGMANCI
eukprot:g5077.t1